MRVLLCDRPGSVPVARAVRRGCLTGCVAPPLGGGSDRPLRMLAFPPDLDDRGRRFVPPLDYQARGRTKPEGYERESEHAVGLPHDAGVLPRIADAIALASPGDDRRPTRRLQRTLTN